MKANELRVGDYISLEIYPDLPRWHRVKARDIFDISEGKITLNSIQPIILTPEILKKCGFRKRYKREDVYQCGAVFIKIEEYNFIFILGGTIRLIKVFHLHQLQNLYFALTGEELKINL